MKKLTISTILLFITGFALGQPIADPEPLQANTFLLKTIENRTYSTAQIDVFAEGLSMAAVDAVRTSLNLQALDSIIESGRSYQKDGTGILTGQSFYLNLPGEQQPVLLQVKTVNQYIADITTYSGKVIGDEYSFFALSNENQRLTGKIIYQHYTYLVKADPKNSDQIIIKIDPRLVPRDPDDTSNTEEKQSSNSKTLNKSAGSGHVRILFLYAFDVSSPNSTVATMLSEFNTALTDSGVTGKSVDSAGIIPLNTTFPGQCKEAIHNDMKDNVGIFSNLDQLRTNANADIVFTMVNDLGPGVNECPPYIGLSGRIGGRAIQSFNINHPFSVNNAFAVAADSYITGDSTGIHEVGHILGAFHPTQSSKIRPRLGLINTDKNWQTIMGGYDITGCDFTGPNSPCERLNRFSNPNQDYMGDPLGTVANNNVSDWLQSTAMDAVSGYKNFIPPVPDTPSNLTINSGFCYGFYDLGWTANDPDTLDYRLYYSNQVSFNNPVQLYGGLEKWVFINVNSGSWYLRVKACNAGGCSGYSNQVVATRVNGCF